MTDELSSTLSVLAIAAGSSAFVLIGLPIVFHALGLRVRAILEAQDANT